MSELNFLNTGLTSSEPLPVPPPPPAAEATPEPAPVTAVEQLPDAPEPAPAPAVPAGPARLHPDDLQALAEKMAGIVVKAQGGTAATDPEAPPPQYGKGELVVYRSVNHVGRTEQLGITLSANDDYDRVPVAWFAGRSGPMPTGMLERFTPEDE